MKKYRKTFGETPEEVVVNATKVFFDQEGIAVVEDDVASTLEQIPGYEFVAEIIEEGKSYTEDQKAPEEPVNEPEEEEPSDEDTDSEDEDNNEDEAPKIKKPTARKRPAPRAK